MDTVERKERWGEGALLEAERGESGKRAKSEDRSSERIHFIKTRERIHFCRK